MAVHASSITDDDTGIEIAPGVVLVDLTVADISSMTADDLRAAMDEAEAQEHASNLAAEELLGDLDLNPL